MRIADNELTKDQPAAAGRKRRLREQTEVVHDLGSPLQSVYNRMLLVRNDPGLPPAARQHAAAALEQMEQVIYLLQKLRGDLPARQASWLEPVDLAALLGRLRDDLEYLREQQPEVAWMEELPHEPLWVRGCPYELTRLFTNLICNAFEAMGGKPGVVKVSADLGLDGMVVAQVADSGEGLPVPRFTLSSPRLESTKPCGQGLGLTICQRIVEGHGGCLEIISKPPNGTVVSVRLPGCQKGESRS